MPAREESHHLVPDAPAPWCLSREKHLPTAVPAWPGPKRRTLQKRGIDLQQTTNYQLSQWDPEDRILRTDFNSDNQKIDTALKTQATALATETSERKAAVTDLSKRAGLQLLLQGSPSSDVHTFDIPLSGIQWSQWKTVHIFIDPVIYRGSVFSLNLNGSSSASFGSASGNNEDTTTRRNFAYLMLFPLCDPRVWVTSLVAGLQSNGMVVPGYCYQDLTKLTLTVTNTTDGVFRPATVYKVWGEP